MSSLRPRAAITRRSSTSDRRALVRAALLLLLAAPADAAPRRKREPPSPPEPAPVEAVQAPPAASPPFADPLPLDVGGVPVGLASLSAQGCNACHHAAHDGWSGSAHAIGWRSPALREAVRDVGAPACTVCHLPLDLQQPERWVLDDDRVDRPITAANERWDATLATEGVTCAACHVRDGRVLAARPPAADVVAPHPLGWSPDLAGAEGCAACHQLTWPGADTPFYDTFGEWQRSPHAAAGITCVDCHLGPGAGAVRVGADHRMAAVAGRAVSVLVDVPSPVLTRGSPPASASVTLQNTGAGHAWPTGTPFGGARLEVALVDPAGARTVVLEADLARVFEPVAPFATTADTRLAAGEQRSFPFELALGPDAPPGDWALSVRLVRTLRGEVLAENVVERAVPLRVE